MTNAQWEEDVKRISENVKYENRKFRKECVTQGIVEIVKDHIFYQVRYRGGFVCYLYGNDGENLKLCAMWNAIKIAETIRKIEGVKHESN